ncbi:OLC1v1038759C1 [Oldenlandia corymbosa var. corymbosa]|uniref:OLC1v1038759C1 n=1 Tax=Oldenlandia corymbosa var. corymbosa TaxID=529605 RepID=A0AAV1D0P7_OLDCO|nr:OLC1v1038759C1 [Oldenlandia corymbosa var. corymbosa]
MPQNVIDINSCMIVTTSGKLVDSELLLKDLKMKCLLWERDKRRRISVVEASQMMVNILAYRSEVGLIAGWDDETGAELYRVDGMGVVMKGTRFASGSGMKMAYSNLESYGGCSNWDYSMALKAIMHVANRTRKGQVDLGSPAPGNHGEDYASVYHVGPSGWELLCGGEMDVNECLPFFGFRKSKGNGELASAKRRDPNMDEHASMDLGFIPKFAFGGGLTFKVKKNCQRKRAKLNDDRQSTEEEEPFSTVATPAVGRKNYNKDIVYAEDDGTGKPLLTLGCLTMIPCYSPHFHAGGEIVNAESIRQDHLIAGLRRAWIAFYKNNHFLDDLGPPSFAFHYKEGGLLLAVNHPRVTKDRNTQGSPSDLSELPQNLTVLNTHTLATISGKLAESELLLKDLKLKCQDNGRSISVAEASTLMADILAHRSEVGLIAGWDDEKGAELYRVDGMGVVMKGTRFASGSGLQRGYCNMEDYGGCSNWDVSKAARAIVHIANRTRKGQDESFCRAPGNHGEDFASVYLIGPSGYEMLYGGQLDVNECLLNWGFRKCLGNGEYVF